MSNHPTAFNARNKTPREIVEHLVMPKEFSKIAGYHNLVLVGPRGIGKTTILKSLTPSGLYFMSKRGDFCNILKEIDLNYIPIYIPAETLWKGNANIIKMSDGGEGFKEIILNGLFVDHCLHELISSFEDSRNIAKKFSDKDAPYWAVRVDEDQEVEISRKCSKFWKLKQVETSFLGVKLALIDRANSFRSKINSFEQLNDHSRIVSDHLDVLLMFRGFFDIVDNVLGEVKKWSINFDEMEIAPKRVLYKLYENLRSFDHRVVLKFSLFPFVDFYDIEAKLSSGSSPVEGQDFIAVNLTSKFANPEYDFSRELVALQCAKRKVDFDDFVLYLNSSQAINKRTRDYKKTRFEKNFEKIFDNAIKDNEDKSFIEYMSDQGVDDVGSIRELTGAKRAQQVRKIAPIVEIRSYYLSEKVRQEGVIRRRSVKGYGYYHGFDQIISLAESNPRAINFYINELLDSFLSGESSSTAQNRVISRNVDRFRALVATQAVPTSGHNRKVRNPLDVVDCLGASISLGLFDKKFRPEPALSFIFKDIDVVTKDILGIAINAGALVVDQRREGKHLLFEITDCRARVSHRIAPFYPLPLITGQSKVINNIPDGNETRKRQPDLLNWGALDD
ncbi:hypothetical protein [Thalassospira lucentensis]|uniref:ORC-CDC6 family AAA ATPase n=1 Tax=Thalassospira lucentensis TaxID=168935 RepID=UPI0029424583|nr:hypothetical protein [Thalassospira lucentensis]WOI09428.1 hypothetical protein R1T41_12890 [Thalassospira lucentensis]